MIASLRIVLLALLVSVSYAGTPELIVDGLVYPFFNEAGHLTHRLRAQRGSASGVTRRLEKVEIEYFASDSATHVVQRLTAANALWNEAAQTLNGTGPVSVTTETNQLSGVGFDLAMATSVLRIRRDFRLQNADFVLTSDHATADLVIEHSKSALKYRGLRRCTAEGNLHLVRLRPNIAGLEFNEAFTDLAIYDEPERTIEMPHPVRTLSAKGEANVATARIELRPASSTHAREQP